jgi:hypothetical protein
MAMLVGALSHGDRKRDGTEWHEDNEPVAFLTPSGAPDSSPPGKMTDPMP